MENPDIETEFFICIETPRVVKISSSETRK